MFRVVIVLFVCIWCFFVDAKWERTPKRLPVTPDSPRLSSDPNVTVNEILIAKTKGKNVCPTRKKRSNCPRYLKRYMNCGALYYTVFKCCDGYETVKGKIGCPKDKFSSNIRALQLAKTLGLTLFLRLVKKTFLQHLLRYSRQITMFIPTNGALNTFFASKIGSKVYASNYYLRLFLLSHIVGGKWPRLRLLDKKRVESILPIKYRTMNIKFYKKVLTIENALVIISDRASSNAIIHVIDRVVKRPQGTMISIMKRHPRLSIFSEGLQRIGHRFLGRNTILAPSDETFAKKGIRSSQKMLDKFQCIKKFLLAHITPDLLYPSVLQVFPTMSTRDVLGRSLTLELINKNIYFNNVFVKVEYIGATDGAILIINRLLSYTDAFSVQQLLQHLPILSTMSKLWIKTEMGQRLRSTNNEITLFAPINSVFRQLSRTESAKLQNTTSAKDFVNFHIMSRKYETGNFYDDMMLESQFNEKTIRINTRRRLICAQGSRVSLRYRNIIACNATIHLLASGILKPSSKSIYDIIKTDQRLTMLYSIVQLVGLTETLNSPSPLTFFAPINDAWSKLSNTTWKEMSNDLNRLRNIVLYHIIAGTFYSCVINRKEFPLSLAGRKVHLSIDRYKRDYIAFNYAKTVKIDIKATNGVVHLLSDVVSQLYETKENWK